MVVLFVYTLYVQWMSEIRTFENRTCSKSGCQFACRLKSWLKCTKSECKLHYTTLICASLACWYHTQLFTYVTYSQAQRKVHILDSWAQTGQGLVV